MKLIRAIVILGIRHPFRDPLLNTFGAKFKNAVSPMVLIAACIFGTNELPNFGQDVGISAASFGGRPEQE